MSPEGVAVVEIDVTCHLEAFRRFLVNSTCRSFIPESYLRDPEVFPEKEQEPGSIYIEAVDKVSLKKIRDISFVNASDVLGIIYTSKSGHSKLKWRQVKGPMGRVSGDASNNSLVNLSMARVISPEYVEELIGREAHAPKTAESAPAQVTREGLESAEAAEAASPPLGDESPGIPLDEEEEEFETAEGAEGEPEDLEEQEREEAV